MNGSFPSLLQPVVELEALAPEAASGAGRRLLAFTMEHQALSRWCWAATAASVHTFYAPGQPLSQCELATQMMGTDCCPPPPEQDPRNRQWALDDALGVHLAGQPIAASLPFEDVVAQIDMGRVVCCHVSIADGHFNALIGYDAANRDVHVADSLYGPQYNVPYDRFCIDYKGGQWDFTYRTQ